MEDGGSIAQWSGGGRRLVDMEDSISGRTSSARPVGGPFSLSASALPSAPQSAPAKRESNAGVQRRKKNPADKLPPIAASKRPSRSTSAKGLRATGSGTPTPRGSASGTRKRIPNAGSRKSSRASSLSKSADLLGSKQRRRSSRPASVSRSLRGSVSKGRKSAKGKGPSRPASGRKRSVKGKKGKRRSASPRGGSKEDGIIATLAALMSTETSQRGTILTEEEIARESFMPDYNLLVMNIVRAQLATVNERQQYLNDAFKALRAHGIQLSSGQDPNAAIEMLRLQVQAEMQSKMDELRVENGTLRGMLDEKKDELEQKTAEMQGLRDKVNRKLMRFEVESESLRAEVQSALQTTTLDVERMKRDLGHRIDVATATLRTPKYDTALRSMQDMVLTVQEEIQEHHDTLTKLIVSIGAQDTFLRDKSDSMHSNFPVRYRDELRKLDKDHLLNLLDVLSFHDPVIETVGKALYILQKSEHSTNVF